MQNINIVHIGYGYWGPNVARNIMASTKTNLHAIVDISEAALNRANLLYRDNVAYSKNYRDFLTDSQVDAFAVATQAEFSYDIALDILNAGKHLFIEKPIATNSQRAEDICNLAKSKGLVVHCDHIMVHHPIIKYVKKMYEMGELGDIIYYDGSRVNLGPIRPDMNAMLDLAVHDLAVIDYLSNGKEPIGVSAVGEKRYGNQEVLTYLTMKYDGFLAHIKTSWISPLKERQTVIGGTKKMLIFDDMKNVDKLAIYDHGIIHREPHDEYGVYEFKSRTGDMIAPYIPQEDVVKNSVEHFADCITNGTDSLTGAEQALRVVKILDKAVQVMI
ncbi:MAG: Gfo/Idh/MocA family oxidoreductase [Firmicutes bacterium]|nr:Gfo/Idh/MocA family oxidoreductase [Bacillota bacterium]